MASRTVVPMDCGQIISMTNAAIDSDTERRSTCIIVTIDREYGDKALS